MSRIIQVLPTLARGDGVGNEAIQIHNMLKKRGVEVRTYARVIGKGVAPELATSFRKLQESDGPENTLRADDVILYHLSIASPVNDWLLTIPNRVLMRYHNITPPEFFAGYQPFAQRKGWDGLCQFRALKDRAEKILAVSTFNKEHLLELGYTCTIDVAPILLDFAEYNQEPDEGRLQSLQDGRKNILFVGRVVPNKKQENVLRAFAAYQRNYDPKARLILVGGTPDTDGYLADLKRYVGLLGLRDEDVIFTGSIPFSQILSCYRAADLFLCMSEHEGFCIPLLEAMHFHVPILAYATTAIPETLGGSGMLLQTNEPDAVAEQMHRILTDATLRNDLIEKQDARKRDFDYERGSEALLSWILAN